MIQFPRNPISSACYIPTRNDPHKYIRVNTIEPERERKRKKNDPTISLPPFILQQLARRETVGNSIHPAWSGGVHSVHRNRVEQRSPPRE